MRAGGVWFCRMTAPDGVEHRVGGVYREVVPHETLVFTHVWQDEPAEPGHETVVRVMLDEIADGGTRLTFRQEGFTSEASRDGHGAGWNECFDRLAEYLAEIQSGLPVR